MVSSLLAYGFHRVLWTDAESAVLHRCLPVPAVILLHFPGASSSLPASMSRTTDRIKMHHVVIACSGGVSDSKLFGEGAPCIEDAVGRGDPGPHRGAGKVQGELPRVVL